VKEKLGLLNSNVVIDYDRDTYTPEPVGALNWVEEMIDDGWKFYISEITVMEVLKGFVRVARPQELNEFKERFQLFRKKLRIKILPLTKMVRRRARELMEKLCRQQMPEKSEKIICDMFIASTALEYSLILFTHNIRHFLWIPDLQVERPDYGGET